MLEWATCNISPIASYLPLNWLADSVCVILVLNRESNKCCNNWVTYVSDSKNGQLYTLTIEAYQISAGLSCPILEDTCPLPWMQHGWINCIYQFLYSIQGQIILKDPWVPTSWREHDWCIMDDVFSQISSINFETFNSIRLYLWVHMLSKIVDSNGKQLCPEILDGTATPFHTNI